MKSKCSRTQLPTPLHHLLTSFSFIFIYILSGYIILSPFCKCKLPVSVVTFPTQLSVFLHTFELVSHNTLSDSLKDLSALLLVAVIQEVGGGL